MRTGSGGATHVAAKVDRDESGFLGGEVAVVVAVVVPVVVVALRAWQREWTEINQVSLGRGAVAVVAVVVVALRA